MSLLNYIVEQNYEETIALVENLFTDKRVNDAINDEELIVTTNYQSLYLHIKALAQYYLMKKDLNRSRRLMSLASELASVMQQNTQVMFKK